MFYNQWVHYSFSAEGFTRESSDDSYWRKTAGAGKFATIERTGTKFTVKTYSNWIGQGVKVVQTGLEALDVANDFLK